VSANSFQPDYFERLYSKEADPWKLATSEYERAKYNATLAVVGKRHFHRVFEPGCSIGILSGMLAKRCSSLLAVDVSELALHNARRNCSGKLNITFRQMQIPKEWPDGRFDLIILSEVLYFLGRKDIQRTASRLKRSLTGDGEVVLVNWIGETDYPCGGDEAAEIFLSETTEILKPTRQARTKYYRLDALAMF
jgi:2-polyprenyl-3-methyl-5-hydroxy-6-metoxy-1,4-benzoquinol methylase